MACALLIYMGIAHLHGYRLCKGGSRSIERSWNVVRLNQTISDLRSPYRACSGIAE